MPPLVVAGAVLFSASLLQGAVGFAMGLFSIPLLVLAGFSLAQAVAMVLTASLVQCLLGVRELRREVPWDQVTVAALLRILALPLGVAAMAGLQGLEEDLPRAVVGGALLVAVGCLSVRPSASPRALACWRAPAFLTSGFTLGMLGMGGPPLVLWVMANRWSSRRTRGFLFGSFLACLPVSLGLLAWAFGAEAWRSMGQALLLAPLILAGSLMGLRLGNRASKAQLRRLAFGILVVLGLSTLLAPWL